MNEEQTVNDIPKDWKWVKLGEVLTVSSGKGLKVNSLKGGEYSVYGGNGLNGYHSEYLLEEPKLIIGRVGVKCGVTHITKPKSWVTDNALIVEPKVDAFDIKFLKLKLGYENLNKLSVSTAQPVISGSKIYAYEILLPPKSIQQHIVSQIEELFSEIDKGVEELKTAQQQLKVYRQAVLKWAFEGKKGSPALLSDIVISYQNGISKRNAMEGKPFKVLRLADIKEGEINSENPREIKLSSSEIEKYQLSWNDILAIRVNGSKDLVGRFVLVKTEENWAFCDHFIRLRLNEKKVLPKLIKFYSESRIVRRFIELNMVSSAGQNTVSQATLSSLQINLPSIEEQQLIVQEIESRLSVCDKIEETITASLKQAEALRQSILKKAFEGKLT